MIVKGLFTVKDIETISRTFEEISLAPVIGHFEPDMNADEATDPLKRYPRVLHPHLFNEIAKKYMLHKPVMDVLADLLGEEALAAQSMFYYKPPGSRGQALHQDNFYIKVQPGTCIAAWTAIDNVDEENGGLLVVPKTNNYEIVCPDWADEQESFTTHDVKPLKDQKPILAKMEKGDVLFFNGNLIHGSYRNKSKDRFRRAFICHYANETASSIRGGYNPLFRADGTTVELESSEAGGPCGIEFDNLTYNNYK